LTNVQIIIENVKVSFHIYLIVLFRKITPAYLFNLIVLGLNVLL